MTPKPAGVPENNRDMIVIGGSAGAVTAVSQLVSALPHDLPASVLITIHRGLEGPGLLSQVLDAAGPLPALQAHEGQRLQHGCIYVAPPDRHMLISGDHLHVRRGPRENRVRPAIDPLFRSAAMTSSTRVIGVVLTGMLNDGTSGLRAIKRCGGLSVVQDPREAEYPDMPRSAIAHAEVDYKVGVAEMAPLLAALVETPRPPPVEIPDEIMLEALIAAEELTVLTDQHKFGPIATLGCPECHGTMQEIREGELVRFRCHTGHAFTLETLRLAQSEAWERTLYAAMRAQQEQAMLARRMAEEAARAGHAATQREFELRTRDYEEGAETIRRLLAVNGLERAAS
jgi:two-component system chemotaxis response regulator CheB